MRDVDPRSGVDERTTIRRKTDVMIGVIRREVDEAFSV
jgi:hypothetical protein